MFFQTALSAVLGLAVVAALAGCGTGTSRSDADSLAMPAPQVPDESFEGTVTAIDAENVSLCRFRFEETVPLEIGAMVRAYRGPRFLGYLSVVSRVDDTLVGRAIGFLPSVGDAVVYSRREAARL